MAAEVQVTWTEEKGIVKACLVEDEKTHLINWVKEVSPPASLLPLDLLSRGFTDTFGGNFSEETRHRGNGQG